VWFLRFGGSWPTDGARDGPVPLLLFLLVRLQLVVQVLIDLSASMRCMPGVPSPGGRLGVWSRVDPETVA